MEEDYRKVIRIINLALSREISPTELADLLVGPKSKTPLGKYVSQNKDIREDIINILNSLCIHSSLTSEIQNGEKITVEYNSMLPTNPIEYFAKSTRKESINFKKNTFGYTNKALNYLN